MTIDSLATPSPGLDPEVDVVIVGGAAAGLAAAIALGRSQRRVVVIDAGEPRNAPADGAHNLLGQEGAPPHELLARGRAEAEMYGVQLIAGQATAASGSIDDFTIEVDGGRAEVHARRVILATGLIDDLPDLGGIREAWGRSVLHCPFCHGWEARGRRIAVIARDENALHQVMLFRQLSDDVTLFLHEAPALTDEQHEQLAALDVPVEDAPITRLAVEGTQVRAIETRDGRTFAVDAVVVAPHFKGRTTIYEALGGTPVVSPLGQNIPADPRGMTPLPGVWAAGNAADPMAMVAGAAAGGVMAGAAVHADLAASDLAAAVQARRQSRA